METGGIELPGFKNSAVVKSLFKSSGGEAILKTGDSVQARVVAFSQGNAQGNAILNLGGIRIPVSTNLTLTPGEIISLKVVSVGSERIVLKLLTESNTGVTVSGSRKENLLGDLLKNFGFKDADIQALSNLIKDIQVSTGKDFVELKQLVASILEKGNTTREINYSKLLSELDELIIKSGDAREILTSIRTMMRANFIHLPLPIDFEGHTGTAEVKIFAKDSNKQGRSKNASDFTIAFALDMPSLGKTRALVEIVDKFINFTIAIENQDGLREAKTLFAELENSLEGLGYKVSRMEAIEKFEGINESAEGLIEEKVGIKLEGIDLRA